MRTVIVIFLFYNYFHGIIAFTCNDSNGTYINPNDYQSYYVCKKNCSTLESCPSEKPYFSSSIQNCSDTPKDWLPYYYLDGHEVQTDGSGSVLYVEQDGYKLVWTFDYITSSNTFTGRYINQTHIQGIVVRRVLSTNCINIFNVNIVVSADRTFCHFDSLDIDSSLCDLTYPYDYSLCHSLSY